MVIKRKNTACLLLPCAEIYLENYFQRNKDFGGTSDHSVRADISDVKLLTNSLILNTNKVSKFYNNFFQKHQLPPSFYLSDDGSGPKVQTLDELTTEETEQLRYIVAMVRRCRQHHDKSSILINNRRKQIREIVHHLKGKETRRVSFSNTVLCHKLVAPQLIYHALFPKEVQLKDIFDPPIRKLPNNLYCICSKCRLGLPKCAPGRACDECFGKSVGQ